MGSYPSPCICSIRDSTRSPPSYSPTNEHFFFFNDTAPTEIYTLSLHDALPICGLLNPNHYLAVAIGYLYTNRPGWCRGDRKSTRLNSSHYSISYAGFCLKKNNLSADVFSSAVVPTTSASWEISAAPTPTRRHAPWSGTDRAALPRRLSKYSFF